MLLLFVELCQLGRVQGARERRGLDYRALHKYWRCEQSTRPAYGQRRTERSEDTREREQRAVLLQARQQTASDTQLRNVRTGHALLHDRRIWPSDRQP